MKKIILFSFITATLLIAACGESGTKSGENSSESAPESMVSDDASPYDPTRGEGKFSADNVKLDPTVDEKLAEVGAAIQSVKCGACHKLTDEKLVGPGWKGITHRRTPHWIMNFITNPDPMIDKDPEVQSQLEICLVRMPNQSLTDEDARNLLEFMRKNDQ